MNNSLKFEYNHVLQKYLPVESLAYVINVIIDENIHLRITKERKSKLGDFRVINSSIPKISVNGNLEKFEFLFILVL
jgi:hypothetical protein